MLDSPDTLVGRLQRGRGDAVRELLRMPVEPAQKTLVQCLCTEGDLVQHHEGFVELVVALSPDLTPWFRWIEKLGPDAAEETRLHAFNLLGTLSARGHRGARAFLDGYVLEGRHWRDALDQYLVDELDLAPTAWSALLEPVGRRDEHSGIEACELAGGRRRQVGAVVRRARAELRLHRRALERPADAQEPALERRRLLCGAPDQLPDLMAALAPQRAPPETRERPARRSIERASHST